MKLLIAFLLVLLVFLQYQLWFSKDGVVDAWHTKQMVNKQLKKNAVQQKRNAILQAEITDLRRGNQAIEERARTELGMIKRGETYYRIVR